MKTAINLRKSESARIMIHSYIIAAMSFGGGILFNAIFSKTGWNDYAVVLGLILAFCGAVYWTAFGVYLLCRLRAV
jgi:hypothetical protein